MLKKSRILISLVVVFIALIVLATVSQSTRTVASIPATEFQCTTPAVSEVWIEGGTFTMGSDDSYLEERPAHGVSLDGYWIDTHEVTNAQFAKFVDETAYITVAERMPDPKEFVGAPPEMLEPGSVLFTPPGKGERITRWWTHVPGVNWKHPEGPTSSIENKLYFPVVHIAFEDAQAYAGWAGRSLPTEAQYEFAARSKKEKERYAWGGAEMTPDNQHKANTWQGFFPIQNTKEDGYEGIAPVACYDANDYGVYDLIGNVWEWTADWYAPRHNPKDNVNPQGVSQDKSYDKNNAGYPVRTIKGGSYLCAPNYCKRYRPAARHAQDTGLGTGHIGLRTVLNTKKAIPVFSR